MRVLMMLALSLFAAACDRAVAERPESEPVARVNGVEISASGLRQGASAAQALEKVIDRELLAQKALAAGLERDPQIAARIDEARRQILAQAWIEKKTTPAAVSREQVHEFYDQNPALFAGRRVYRTRELAVSAPAEMIDLLRAESARAAGLDEVAEWLRLRQAPFSTTAQTQPAEEWPLAWLPQLARMKAGEIAVFRTPLGASVVQLVHAEEAPLSEREAGPLIEQFLAGRARLELAATEVRRLRESARIDYAANFKRSIQETATR